MTDPNTGKSKKNLEFIALDQTQQTELSKKFKKLKKKKRIPDAFDSTDRGVVFIKHLPHGFFEPQMKRYFEQFGTVTRLRLSRSKKTGRSKGYAYIEFECEAVAKVVAETMNNYLMFEHCLKCELLPKDKVHLDTFKGCNRIFTKPCTRKTAIRKFNNQSQDPKKVAKRDEKRKRKIEKLGLKLKELGVDLDLSKLTAKADWKPPPRKLAAQGLNTDDAQKVQAKVSKDELPVMDVSAEMIIDEEDEEVNFKTPPQSVKIKKRSLRRCDDQDDSTVPKIDLEMVSATEEANTCNEISKSTDAKEVTKKPVKCTPKSKKKSSMKLSRSVKKPSKRDLLKTKRLLLNKTL